MKALELNQRRYSGNAKPAGKSKMKQVINKAFVCQFFGVKPNTPDEILKEAIKRHTGDSMSFGAFKHKQQNRLIIYAKKQ